VRAGSGRKAIGAQPMKVRTVMMTDDDAAFFMQIGDGNLSAGVRLARTFLQRNARRAA
jgi:hypothetical protein